MREKHAGFANAAAIFAVVLCMAVFAFSVNAEETEEFEAFYRIDRDDPAAYDRELENLRFVTGDLYEFQEVSEKYGIDPDYVPDETGLATLDISASAQFNGWQFHDLADQLKEQADGREIYVLDLRRESHALLNDRPFSVYALHDWSNLGLSTEEIMTNEDQLFSSLVGTTIEAHPKEGEGPGEAYEYEI